MTRIAQQIAAALIVTGGLACLAFTPASAETGIAPALHSLPPAYRDWRLISVAHEEGKQKDIRAILANDMAYNAARGKSQYPDGDIIGR